MYIIELLSRTELNNQQTSTHSIARAPYKICCCVSGMEKAGKKQISGHAF